MVIVLISIFCILTPVADLADCPVADCDLLLDMSSDVISVFATFSHLLAS